MKFFNKNKFTALILIMFSFGIPNFSFAQVGICSLVGYTVATINGVNTTESEAKENMKRLKEKLGIILNSQSIDYEYFLNKTHGEIADLIDSGYQKSGDGNLADFQDADFAQMLTDASTKLTTQKVLLVSHSQGNFYANAFYDDVIDKVGGIPNESIGVYAVASPSSHISGISNPGNANYTLSDTDSVIDSIPNILKPNVHIDFKNTDDSGHGHSFSNIYLTYAYNKIIPDIQSALNKLKNNNVQKVDAPCILPPKLTIAQKIQGTALAIVDPISIPIQKGIVVTTTGAYAVGKSISNGYLALIQGAGNLIANSLGGIINHLTGAVVLSDDDLVPIVHDPVNTQPIVPDTVVATVPATQTTKTKPLVININDNPKTNPTSTIVLADATPANTQKFFVGIPKIPSPVLLGGGGGGGGQSTPEDPPITPPDPTPPDPVLPDPIIPPDPDPDPIIPPPVADTTPPTVTILGKNPLDLFLGATYHESGATALDDVDGAITPVIDGSVNTSTPGIYEIGYTATDASLNSVRVVRTVNVKTLNINFPATSTSNQTFIDSQTWSPADNPHIVSGEVQLSPGSTLVIEPGTIIKFANADSYILINNGTLDAEGTPTDKIYFTSIKDDTVGGDTNGDGGATSPQAGDWRNIHIIGDGTFSGTLSNVVVRYAGSSNYPAIYNSDENLAIANSIIDYNNSIGIYETHHIIYPRSIAITNSEISNQDYGIYLDIGYGVAGSITMHNSNIHGNYIYGVYVTPYGYFGGDNNFWGDPTGPNSPDLNPTGLGDKIFVPSVGYFTPWLTSAP